MSSYNGMEIAIIGMSGRFPGAPDIHRFWDNLKNGIESIARLTDEEILGEGEDRALLEDPLYVKANAYVTGKEYFDAAFFGYRPEEAILMDPQLRIFHEQCWHALDDAGYNVRRPEEQIGLFAGANPNVNWEVYSVLTNRAQLVDDYTASQLRDITYLCSRVAYLLDLKGPAVFQNTACSTSLVAVHRAVVSLLLRECTIALAGGITINNYSKRGYLYQEGMISSSDGHCRAFDEKASGTVGSEGAGVVVLKRLEDALKDKDHIYAVIRGCAINNDGHNKMSFTAPGVEGQSRVILKAMSMAGVSPATITYVETHGTGTRLGDPVEIGALKKAFGKSGEQYCAVGSVKTNIGHVNAAAGIAGFIKTVLALKNRQIPPSLHFESANAGIDFSDSPFYVNTALREWHTTGHPLRAGVSSFGIGGTNAHVILEEAPPHHAPSDKGGCRLLTVSAKTATALKANISSLAAFLRENKDATLPDITYTLNRFRTPMAFRKAFVCRNTTDAQQQLSAFAENDFVGTALPENNRPRVIFMFPGQGSQYKHMCQGLYFTEKVFRQTADECFDIVQSVNGFDLRSLVFSDDQEGDRAIHDTAVTQPLLFCMEYALARLVMHWGIIPDSMIGHSIGEYVAACISGVLSPEDALRLVVKRGELMQQVAGGAMLSVAMEEKHLIPLLEARPDISLAAVNSTAWCVVSGPAASITSFMALLNEKGYSNKMIRTSHAFHSHMMDEILPAFESWVSSVKRSPCQIPYLSNVTGAWITDEDIAIPAYWARHLREKVMFAAGIETLLTETPAVFVEVGPGNTLATFVRSNQLRGKQHKVISLVKHAHAGGEDAEVLLSAIGELWESGIQPEWGRFYQDEDCHKVPLPPYAFDRITFPVQVDAFEMLNQLIAGEAPGRKNISQWFYIPTWKKAPFSGRVKRTPTGCQLILADDSSLAKALIQEYRASGATVVTVKAGRHFHALSDHTLEINVGDYTDYTRLYSFLSDRQLVPHTIIYCLGISTPPTGEDSLFFDGLLYLAKAGLIRGNNLKVVTAGLHPVADNTALPAMKALLPALSTVLTQELPGVTTGHIDICAQEEMTGRLLADICMDLQRNAPGESIAYRWGARWKRIYDNFAAEKNEENQRIKNRGVYLITGGLGDAGFTIAQHLIQEFDAAVILTGRSILPPREKWDEYLSDMSAPEDIKQKTARLRSLAVDGATVLYYDCDVADVATLSAVWEAAETITGPVNGVFHTAGVLPGMITTADALTVTDIHRQLLPKVKGIQVLQQVAKSRPLDFCLVTSSIAAVLGGIGFGAYAPANAFMDYFIRSGMNTGDLKNWTSVCFDALDFTRRMPEAIQATEVFEVIRRVLAMEDMQPNIIVSVTELQNRLDTWVHGKSLVGPVVTAGLGPGTDNAADNAAQNTTGLAPLTFKLLQLWRDFFGKEDITADDDFFEIGGDSLKALTLVGRIHKMLQADITISHFFSHSTVRKLGDFILSMENSRDGAPPSDYIPLSPAPEQEYYTLSAAQKRLFVLFETNKTMVAYNMPQTVKLIGKPDIALLQQTFEKLIHRHESLRTSFSIIDNEPVQRILKEVDFSMEIFEADEATLPAIAAQFFRPFQLDTGPLIRVGIVTIAPEEHILMTDMAHIISDGVSCAVLVDEFVALYNGRILQPLELQYKDFAVWEQSADRRLETDRHKDFWLSEFSGILPVPDLPADYDRPQQKNYEGNTLEFRIGQPQTQQLKQLSEASGSTLFITLFSVYAILLQKLSGQEDLIIGINTTGRFHPDLEKVIGLFVNTLPIRVSASDELSFTEFLDNVKMKMLACLDHQSFPYDTLLQVLKPENEPGRNPLFDVMFVYQNYEKGNLEIPGLSLVPFDMGASVAKFDLMLTAVEEGDDLRFFLEYSASLFKPETVERFCLYFQRILTSVLSEPGQGIGSISLSAVVVNDLTLSGGMLAPEPE